MKKIYDTIETIKELHSKRVKEVKGCTTMHYAIIIGKHTTPICSSFVNLSTIISSVHAEIKAIEEYHKIDHKKQFSCVILVIRLSKTLKLGRSEPCQNCTNSILQSGIPINRIIYSTAEGTIKWQYRKDYISLHISYGFKKLKVENNSKQNHLRKKSKKSRISGSKLISHFRKL